jgi:voltage-gated potassium channel
LDHTRHVVIALLFFAFLIALGTAGYALIEGWGLMDGLYMTVITIATVGYGEVHEISQSGRVFTVVLIFLGVGFFLYVIGNLAQFLVEGRIRVILGRRKLDKQINQIRDHYVVCGYGRIGRVLSRFLVQRHMSVVVIEQDQNRISVMDEDGVLYVAGAATDEANLAKAGIERAKGLTTALGTDAENILVILTARQLNPDLFIVARASQDATEKTLYTAGANVVVSPYDIGARRMAQAILHPAVIDFLDSAFVDESVDIQIEEIPVKTSSDLVDIRLQDSGIRQNLNLIIIAIKKADGSMLFNPSAQTKVGANDTLIVVGENESLLKLERRLNP